MTGPRGGRPRKPTRLKLLHGDEPRHVNHREPQPAVADKPPAPFREMSAEAKKVWRSLARDLHAAGLLTRVDRWSLRIQCERLALIERIEGLGVLSRLLVRDRDGDLRTNPLWRQWRDVTRASELWFREFGMTPASRSGIEVPDQRTEEELARLLFG
ncbi:MAG TPA: P27 family phage terminase small subunit [Actinomycetota bacterium]|nr:P27 family phage terminase small subunit [Actinomycetota bacterium]